MAVTTTTPSSLFVIAALQLPGVGPAKVRSWLTMMPDVSSVSMAAGFQGYSCVAQAEALRKAELILQKCTRLGIQTMTLADRDYPEALRKIADPPPVLYVRGEAANLRTTCFSVVGTRKASQRGLQAASALGQALAQNGVCVVSGLALGIDAAAHTGALAANGRTVAVLAHGLDTIYPSANRNLGLRIADCGGTLVSEHPPGIAPRPCEFVRRNRIQSGLSLGSVIVESGEEGGAIHQARFTHDQKRLLAVVLPERGRPHDDFNYAGGQLLQRTLGATPIARGRELLDLLLQTAERLACA